MKTPHITKLAALQAAQAIILCDVCKARPYAFIERLHARRSYKDANAEVCSQRLCGSCAARRGYPTKRKLADAL